MSQFCKNRIRQAASFRAEDKCIGRLILNRMIASQAPSREGIQVDPRILADKRIQGIMNRQARPFMIIQTGAFQFAIIKPKAERADEMEICAAVGAQAYNIAGILWDLGLH